MSYKNYNWEVVATDYNSSLFRNYLWTESFYYYTELNNTGRPALGVVSRNDDIEYITDIASWTRVHEELKKQALTDDNFIDTMIIKSHQEGEKFNSWTEEAILNTDLSQKSGLELYELLEKFVKWQAKMYALGTVLPLLDFQNFSYVENFLNNYLKKKLNPEEFKDYYTVFTEPPANSFAQDQEEDLLNIIAKYWEVDNWQSDLKSKDIGEIKKLYPDFYNDLVKHTYKHCWVYYVYNGPESTVEDFLNFARDYLIKLEHPDKLLKEISNKRQEVINKKEEFVKKYKPSDVEKKMLDLAGKFVWGKPRRKDYQSKSYYHVKKLQLEIAKRLNLSLTQLRSAPFDMIKNALVDNKEVDTKIINTIKKFHIVLPNDDGSLSILYGKEAEEFNEHIKRVSVDNYNSIKEINGSVAYKGKVKGIVKIVNTVSDMSKMKYGDILISTQTSPSIISAMKKASAFVTDEGGLTCHAAIVSREMCTPCVVGTKIATQIFKDGDRVEVDANNGLVRKI